MPRPGPRPYECVRRAWHSERHGRMRGSILQQIFRVVTDAHSSATKKNREWQEKLPVVVFRAEEIMYSKANSEVEYLNPDTLWERLNDAINTIIRIDESTETGELLPPCVEAALNLGCKPVRASRSERHNNSRTYLTPRTQEAGSGSPTTIGELCPQFLPLQSANPLNLTRATTAVPQLPVSDCSKHASQNSKLMSSFHYPFTESFSAGHHRPLTMETKAPLNSGSVYPLYSGSHFEATEPPLRTTPENNCSGKILVGTPVITQVPEPAGIGLLQNFSSGRSQHVMNRTAREAAANIQENSCDRECDLSLRLGQYSHPCSSREKSLACENEDNGPRDSLEGRRFSHHRSLQINRELCFYHSEAGYGPWDSTSNRCNFESGDKYLETTFRKRKAALGNSEEDGQFCRQLGVPSNRFTSRIQRPGL